jgi:NNP family nitrate/nitrite transporter-like MFS transporter
MVGIAVIMTMFCSFFVQAGEGSTFALVPLVKRRVTGQIAGNVVAYGNVGAVAYLNIYASLPEGDAGNITFFQILGVAALIVGFLCIFVLEEPKGSFAESHEGEEDLTAHDNIQLESVEEIVIVISIKIETNICINQGVRSQN